MTGTRPTLAALRHAWRLTPEGAPFATPSSLLQFVRTAEDDRAVLKLARTREEARAGRALAAWTGGGAAPVLRVDGPALLLRRASGGDLVALHRRGESDAALDRIAEVAAALHRGDVPENATVSLDVWFEALRRRADRDGGMWRAAWEEVEALFASVPSAVPLHGDLHHANVLDFGGDGWRAIDPKALRGDPAFEFATTLLNPDRGSPGVDPAALRARAARLAAAAGLDAGRILAWTEAFALLSAAWALEDGADPSVDLGWARSLRASCKLR